MSWVWLTADAMRDEHFLDLRLLPIYQIEFMPTRPARFLSDVVEHPEQREVHDHQGQGQRLRLERIDNAADCFPAFLDCTHPFNPHPSADCPCARRAAAPSLSHRTRFKARSISSRMLATMNSICCAS